MRCFIILGVLCTHFVFAQSEDTTRVTYLSEVSVYGMPVTKYGAGTRAETITNTSAVLLDDALAQSPSVYFKTYGSGQLSSIAFRGTSASHTAVMWNGLNINSPSLGQTDFSLLPAFLLEEVTLQYGTSSSQYGSSAIGGSVLLNMAEPEFKKGVKVSLQQSVASFGNFFTGGKIEVANNRWVVRSRAMHRSIENNFPYYSRAVGHRKTQDDASVKQYGFDQQIHYKISDQRTLSAEILYTSNVREIQPSVLVNDSDETLENDNLRLNLNYQGVSGLGQLYISAGLNRDELTYNEEAPSRTTQVTGLFNIDKALSNKISFRYGASWSRYDASIDNYRDDLHEHHYDVFASINYLLSPNWLATINLRQSWYTRTGAPLSPSLGTEYKIHEEQENTLKVRAQLSRGYRIPTLNDRYWVPGGNPDLVSENAWQGEVGLDWKHQLGKKVLKADITAYNIRAEQWIVWLPTEFAYWAPRNLQEVNIHGIETTASIAWKLAPLQFEQGVNYSFTRSINQQGLTSTDQNTVDKQLPYVPIHTANLHNNIKYYGWTFNTALDFTGLRYTTLDNTSYQSLDPYLLVDLFLSRVVRFSDWSVIIRGEAKNLFDIYYENIQNRAMPGRNYSITLVVNFKHSITQ